MLRRLNEKGDTLATTFMDEPYEYPDGSPVNNATRSYGGETTIRKAIQNSINVVAVQMSGTGYPGSRP